MKRTARNARRRHCLRFVKLAGSAQVDGKAGHNGFHISGRWNGRKLSPGAYRLVAVARDGSGNVSKERKRNFRVVR